VTQQVQEIEGKTVIGSPKTKGSQRVLWVPGPLVAGFRAQWEQLPIERHTRGVDWKEHGLIFPSDVGTPWMSSNLNRQFDLLRKRAGLSLRLHDLRHTFATLMGELEIEERVIAAMFGHTPATVTRRYAKATLAQMRAAVEKLVAMLRSATGPPKARHNAKLLPQLLPKARSSRKPRRERVTPGLWEASKSGAGDGTRTRDHLLGRQGESRPRASVPVFFGFLMPRSRPLLPLLPTPSGPPGGHFAVK
jgi:hypothetical protein